MSARTILHIEDNAFNRKLVRTLLARTSYRLLEAADGIEGLAAVQERRPDLVLLDIQLPRLSGIEVIRRLRGDARTADLPIIVITSFALSGDDRKALEAGASHYLTKPYSPRQLLDLIRAVAPEA